MDIKEINEFRNEFEAMQQKVAQDSCDSEGCVEEEYEDYPDYLRAIYAEIMPPFKSGITISRWDLKRMAAQLDESFALDVRERMFKNFMQWIANAEDMKAVVGVFKEHMDMKSELYREYSKKYPSSKEIFDVKIVKIEKAKKYLDKVYVEFFT